MGTLLLMHGIGWLTVLPPLAGFILSAFHLSRSRWAAVLVGGFGIQTVVTLFYRVALMLPVQHLAGGSTQALLALASLIGVGAASVVVAGVAGLLAETKPSPPFTGGGEPGIE
jgi:hypothetical protein